MSFCLKTTVIKSEECKKVQNAIILLHGYGGDGRDISSLTLNWKRYLKDTIFLCPDAQQKCKINPNGFQWFDLSIDDQEYILNESKKSEITLKKYIEEVKSKYNLNDKNLCLSGFSQGCMMSISVGLTREFSLACIVGFSGKIINKEDLKKRILSKTNILLVHGDSDTVVDPYNLLEAKDYFLREKIEIITKLIKNCDHQISLEASSYALSFIKENFKNK